MQVRPFGRFGRRKYSVDEDNRRLIMAPKVSVIMATHNHAHFLPRSLGSIKAQTYPDYEVIVVNNGSTDNTEQVVQALAWDKLRYIKQKNTGSVAGPRNTGLKEAQGKYVAFLDSDDDWLPTKLERVMAILNQHSEIDLLCHDMIRRTETKILNRIRVGPKTKGSMLDCLLFAGNFILGSASVVKKDALLKVNGFDISKDFVNAEDYEAWLRLAEVGAKFYFLNEVLGSLLFHSSNLSNNIKRSMDNLRNVVNHHYRLVYPQANLIKYLKYRQAIAITYFIEGRNWQQIGNHSKANRLYFKSILTFPFIWKVYIFLVISCLHLEKVLERLKIYTIKVE
jgi:glycosyltransferase involved in cell wall biosynthesis